jgi:hypothetical protein
LLQAPDRALERNNGIQNCSVDTLALGEVRPEGATQESTDERRGAVAICETCAWLCGYRERGVENGWTRVVTRRTGRDRAGFPYLVEPPSCEVCSPGWRESL